MTIYFITFTMCATKLYIHHSGCKKQTKAYNVATFGLQMGYWRSLLILFGSGFKFYAHTKKRFKTSSAVSRTPVLRSMLWLACLQRLIFHLFPESFLCNILHVPIHLSVDLSETNSTANGYGFSNTYSVGIIFQTISRYIPIPLANHYQLILINYLLQHINE